MLKLFYEYVWKAYEMLARALHCFSQPASEPLRSKSPLTVIDQRLSSILGFKTISDINYLILLDPTYSAPTRFRVPSSRFQISEDCTWVQEQVAVQATWSMRGLRAIETRCIMHNSLLF